MKLPKLAARSVALGTLPLQLPGLDHELMELSWFHWLCTTRFNVGAWDQPGLTTSMPDAVAGLTTIGIATGQQVRGLGPTDTDTFAGQTITGASVVAMYTYAGDANLDGTIDGGDYGIIDNFAQVPGADGYANGDFNYDAVIDGGDYGIIDNNIQAQGAPFPTSAALSGASLSGATAIPEPASTSICAIGLAAAAVLPRCRRHRRHLRHRRAP